MLRDTIPPSDDHTAARTLLASVFLPGLYLTLLASLALVVVTAAALIGILYAICSSFGRIPVGLIALIGLGALSGVWAVLRGLVATVQRAETRIEAVRLEVGDAPQLFKAIRRIAEKLGATMPNNVLLSVGPDFFVTEARVVAFDGTYSGRTLCISAPLVRLLTENEFCGVLAHELAHFTGHDTAFSRRFYPIYRGTAVALSRMGAVLDAGDKNERAAAAALPLLLSMFLLRWYLNRFAQLESRVGRARELRADREAARVVGAESMASALIKVHAYGPAWSEIIPLIHDGLDQGKAFVNTSAFFAEHIATDGSRIETTIKSEGAVTFAHPTDTHPPLGERLRSLGLRVGATPSVEDGAPAAALVDTLKAKEEHLTDVLTALIRHVRTRAT